VRDNSSMLSADPEEVAEVDVVRQQAFAAAIAVSATAINLRRSVARASAAPDVTGCGAAGAARSRRRTAMRAHVRLRR